MTTIDRLARATALIAALVVAGSTPALAAQDSAGQATNLTISPYIEVAGIAAALDFSASGTFGTGGELRANSFSGINSGPGSSFSVGTNNSAGYSFSTAIEDMAGQATSDTIAADSFNVQLTSAGADTVDFSGAMLSALATYADYAGPSGTSELLWTCDGACVDADPAAELYLAKLQLEVPAGLAVDDYVGAVTYLAETL